MSQNDQAHFKNLTAFAAKFLKCVWPFWDIMHERVKSLSRNVLFISWKDIRNVGYFFKKIANFTCKLLQNHK